MGRAAQMLPDTAEAVTEEAQALVSALEPVRGTMNEYESKIVGNIKAAEACNRTGLIFLRAAADYYLTEEGEEN